MGQYDLKILISCQVALSIQILYPDCTGLTHLLERELRDPKQYN